MNAYILRCTLHKNAWSVRGIHIHFCCGLDQIWSAILTHRGEIFKAVVESMDLNIGMHMLSNTLLGCAQSV